MLTDKQQRQFIPLASNLFAAAAPVAAAAAAGRAIDPAAMQHFVAAEAALSTYLQRAGVAIATTPRPLHAEEVAHAHG